MQPPHLVHTFLTDAQKSDATGGDDAFAADDVILGWDKRDERMVFAYEEPDADASVWATHNKLPFPKLLEVPDLSPIPNDHEPAKEIKELATSREIE